MPVTEVIPAIIVTKNSLKPWYVIVYLWLTLISFAGIKLSSLYQLYSYSLLRQLCLLENFSTISKI